VFPQIGLQRSEKSAQQLTAFFIEMKCLIWCDRFQGCKNAPKYVCCGPCLESCLQCSLAGLN